MSVDVLASCDIKEDTPASAIAKFEARLGKMPSNTWLAGSFGYPRPEVVYTYEKLLELKDHPAAKCWPPYLDPAYKNHRGVFDPARWHMDDRTWMKEGSLMRGEMNKGLPERERGEMNKGVSERDFIKSMMEMKGEIKQKDVERVRERPSSNLGDALIGQADDAIILSPQRGSFLSGCQAAKDEINLRPDPPSAAANARRVGSGRILRPDKDEFVGAGRGEFPSAGRGRGRGDREGMSENRDMKYGFRGEGGWNNDRGDNNRPGDREDRPGGDRRDKYGFRGGWGGNDDRNSNHRDLYSRGRGDSYSRGRGDYHNHGMRHQHEPEWMNESVSINDVMVLKGFDDDKNNPRNSRPNSRQSNRSDNRSRHSSGVPPVLPGNASGTRPVALGLPGHILHQLEQQQQRDQQKQPKQQLQGADGNSKREEKKKSPSPSELIKQVVGDSFVGEADALFTAIKQQQNAANTQQHSVGHTGDGLDFDQFFEGNLASLLGGMVSTPEEEEVGPANTHEAKPAASGSRFSQFFTKPRSRRSSVQSVQDELVGMFIREINGESNSTSIKIPSPEESNKYFTPISPAAKTEGNNILEMLQKGQQQQNNHQQHQPPQQQVPNHQQQQATNPQQMLQHHLQRQLGLQAHQFEQIGLPPPQQLDHLSLQQRQQLEMMHQHQRQQQQQQQEQAAGGRRPDESMVQKLENGLKKSLGLNGAPQLPPPQQPPAAPPVGRPAPPLPHPLAGGKGGDMSAFNKLVAQVKQNSTERSVPPPNAPPKQQPPMNMPNQGQRPGGNVNEHELLEHGQGGGGRMHSHQQPPAARINVHQAIPPQLLLYLDQYPLNPEVLKRPEAESLMMGVNSGNVPIESLVHQLSNPNLQGRQREVILTVLKLRLTGSNNPGFPGLLPPHLISRTSPLPPHLIPRTSPLPSAEHLLAQPPPPPAHSRVSPLMFAAGMGATNHLAVSPTPNRVPSPQEMTKLTQQILQQALIKKKLEEQRENYRKKQEDDGKEPLRKTESAGSPLLAFTPTSVMRKTAAERKDSDPKVQVPELKISAGGNGMGPGHNQEEVKSGSLSPGRAIKGKGTDRPSSLDINGMLHAISALPPLPGAPPPGMAGMPPMPGMPSHHHPGVGPGGLGGMSGVGSGGMPGQAPGVIPGMQGLPPNLSMLLANQGLQQNMLGFPTGAANPLNAFLAAGAGGPRFPAQPPHHPHHHPGGMVPPPGGFHLGPPSPRHHQHYGHGGHQAVSPVQNNSSLSRFFTSDVLAAAGASSGKTMKLPPLPTGQALTLEEIERQQSAAAKV